MDSPNDVDGSADETARILLEGALKSLTESQWDVVLRDAGQALAIANSLDLQRLALDALSIAHFALGNEAAACTSAIEALRLGSADSAFVVVQVAKRYATDGDVGRALGLLETAHSVNRKTGAIVGAIAHQHHRSGNYPDAIKWFEELDRVDPAGATSRFPAVDSLRQEHARNLQTRALLGSIGTRLGALTDFRVCTGPFAGQRLEVEHDFGWVATLLGCYEMELHPAIEQVIASRPTRIINIGCSGGYYAVGFARRVPGTQVVAYDIDAPAREACQRAATLNNVADHIDVRAACTPIELQALAGRGTFVFSDCEGYELQLLDPTVVPALKDSTIMVEMHDVWIPNLTPRLLKRFMRTHEISNIAMLPRDVGMYPVLQQAGFSEAEMSYAVSDFRPPGMTWAYMVPRS